MRVYLYFDDGKETCKDTTRVTVFNTLNPKNGRLVLGTKPREEEFPLNEISWFWIEED